MTEEAKRGPWYQRGTWYYDDRALVVEASDFMTLREAAKVLGRWPVPLHRRLARGEIVPANLTVEGGPFGVTRQSVEAAAQRWANASRSQKLRSMLGAWSDLV